MNLLHIVSKALYHCVPVKVSCKLSYDKRFEAIEALLRVCIIYIEVFLLIP